MAASNVGMQDDGLLSVDPLVVADPWALTPRSGALTTCVVPHEWPGWPTDKELLQTQLPAMHSAKTACVSQSVPCSNASSKSTSAVSHRGEGSVGSYEGLKRETPETAPLF
eukprot:2047627-Karenia_brevis.AAC.1